MLMDDEFETETPHPWRRRIAVAAGVLATTAALGALVYGAMKDTGPRTKKSVQEIAVLRPPPPPPPPKVEEKLPEPEIKKEEVKIPEEKPVDEPQPAEAPPPGPQLGLDAEGGAGNDGFGMAARKGGRDITAAGGGDRHAWYAGMLRAQIQKALARNDALRGTEFKVVVHVWVDANGNVQRAQLAGTTGDRDRDRNLQLALADLPALQEVPPEDLRQPVKFRIASTF